MKKRTWNLKAHYGALKEHNGNLKKNALGSWATEGNLSIRYFDIRNYFVIKAP